MGLRAAQCSLSTYYAFTTFVINVPTTGQAAEGALRRRCPAQGLSVLKETSRLIAVLPSRIRGSSNEGALVPGIFAKPSAPPHSSILRNGESCEPQESANLTLVTAVESLLQGALERSGRAEDTQMRDLQTLNENIPGSNSSQESSAQSGKGHPSNGQRPHSGAWAKAARKGATGKTLLQPKGGGERDGEIRRFAETGKVRRIQRLDPNLLKQSTKQSGDSVNKIKEPALDDTFSDSESNRPSRKQALTNGRGVWRPARTSSSAAAAAGASRGPDLVASVGTPPLRIPPALVEQLDNALNQWVTQSAGSAEAVASGEEQGRPGAPVQTTNVTERLLSLEAGTLNPALPGRAQNRQQPLNGVSDWRGAMPLDRRRRSPSSATTSGHPAPAAHQPLPPSLVSVFNLLSVQNGISVPDVVASLGERPDLDEQAWGLLVRHLAMSGNLDAAVQCHAGLVQRGVHLPVEDALSLIKAMEDSRNTRLLLVALQQFRMARRLTTAVFNAFLVAFNKCGQPHRVVVMFERLGGRVRLDHSSYHQTLKACQQLRLWETATSLLHQMETKEIWPEVADYTMGITACARARQWIKALDLIEAMDRVGCPCNVAAFNSAINACARVGEWQHALRLLLRMRTRGVVPNVVTWSSVLTACGQGPASPSVIKQVLTAMLRVGCEPNHITWTAAIDAFGRAGDWRAAEACFAGQLQQGIMPCAPSWCALIQAYGDAAQWTRALAAFESMRKAGIRPDTAHWTAVIRAVGSRQAWASTEFGRVTAMQALVGALYQQMKDSECTPNEVTYTSMIQVFGRVGQWRSAMSVFAEALDASAEGRCKITRVMLNALAGALADSRRFQRLWDLVMTDMQHKYGIEPDRVSYTILIKACVRANKGRILSGQVYRRMQEAGVKPDSRTFDWLVQGYEQTGLPDRAWQVLKNMGS